LSRALPRGTPGDQRVDPAAILSFLDAVGERPDIEMHSLMVVRHGRVVAEGWWAPYSAERPHTLRVEVIFLETPHRMDITCSLPGRTAEAVWRHPPLTPSELQHLHCPG
jgi:hypothetical protein